MQALATLNEGSISAVAPQSALVRTHISDGDEILHDTGSTPRIILVEDRIGDPICDLVCKLDDQGDVIVNVAFLVPRPL